MWHLPADFWTAIQKVIQHLSQDTHGSTSPPLPPNFSQPKQESPPSSLQRKKLDQLDRHLQGPPVTQVAEIRHCACPLEAAGRTSPGVVPQHRHSNVGPLPLNILIPQ
jgi:hypothetical protein